MKQDELKETYINIIYVYKDDIYRIIFNVVEEHYTAEDLTQTVMANAWRSFLTLKDYSKSKAWLKAITRNVLREYMRKKKVILSYEDRQLISDIHDESVMKRMEYDIIDLIVKKEKIKLVLTALDSLNEKYRKIIRERIFADIPLKEIADKYEMNYGSVRAFYSKGLRLLKEAYEKLEKGGGLNG